MERQETSQSFIQHSTIYDKFCLSPSSSPLSDFTDCGTETIHSRANCLKVVNAKYHSNLKIALLEMFFVK